MPICLSGRCACLYQCAIVRRLCAQLLVFDSCVDMKEVRAVLGSSGCYSCLVPDAELADYQTEFPPRTVIAARRVIREARLMVLERGKKGKAEAHLSTQRLHPMHLSFWNPFLRVPFMEFDCFPMDFLHGVYVQFE